MAEALRSFDTRCCIVGGGPAGMMLGFLLARAGVDIVLIEKHADFLRDFRGDTIHPSTLEVMHELGLLDDFLKRPHAETRRLALQIGEESVTVADFTHLPTRCRFIAFMPQWDFLDFLADHAKTFPGFRLLMETEATDLIESGGRVTGVRARSPQGPVEIRAGLVVGADGRHSTVRERGGFARDDLGAPMDVLWLRLPRRDDDREETLGRVKAGSIFVMINRGDYWQCALVIAKGSAEKVRSGGLPAFRETIATIAPFLRDRVATIADWDQVKLLTVAVDRLRRWHRPGLLCIGDAAHAMSPIGGVGINLAVQDAVAAANVLTAPLLCGAVADAGAARVQRRREFPAKFTQKLQLFAQNRIISRVLNRPHAAVKMPAVLKLFDVFPVLRRIPARLIGIGIRPEHVKNKPLGGIG